MNRKYKTPTEEFLGFDVESINPTSVILKPDPAALAEETRALLGVRDFPLALERVGQAYKLAKSGDTSAEADLLMVELLASALTLLGRERWLEK